jgi:hypothetical protein
LGWGPSEGEWAKRADILGVYGLYKRKPTVLDGPCLPTQGEKNILLPLNYCLFFLLEFENLYLTSQF